MVLICYLSSKFQKGYSKDWTTFVQTSSQGDCEKKGKICSVPLKDLDFRKIPSKDWALEKYHRKLAPSLSCTTTVNST
jgi:hypothetical protein